jgi:hypothetical protein
MTSARETIGAPSSIFEVPPIDAKGRPGARQGTSPVHPASDAQFRCFINGWHLRRQAFLNAAWWVPPQVAFA